VDNGHLVLVRVRQSAQGRGAEVRWQIAEVLVNRKLITSRRKAA